VKKGSYAWSSSYDRDLDDVFDLQAGISRDIARALTLRLVPGQTGSLENRSSSDLAAYDYYLKGNAAARGFTEDSLRLAISYYDSALKIDPRYARAYAGIATAYYNLADDFWLPNRSYPLVRQNALKAISLDDKNADAYGLLASYELAYGWNWEEAYSHARRAVELNRNSSFAHLMLAWYSIVTNDESGAVREAQTVATLDPYSFIIGGNVITLMRAAGRHDLAIGESRRMLAAGVGPPPTLRAWISWDMMLSGDNAAARTQLDSALALDPSCCRRTRALLLAHTGHIIEGRQLLDSIVESRRAAGAYYRADWIAEVHAALGDANAMFASLDQAWTDRSLGLPLLAHNAEFRRYSSDPKFVELKRRLRLPP
jgi:tetratricopeptide (TPR) repeat protein